MTLFRLAVALSALLLAGCKNIDIPEEIASIFVEASPTSGGTMRQEVRLPVSQITITVLTIEQKKTPYEAKVFLGKEENGSTDRKSVV